MTATAVDAGTLHEVLLAQGERLPDTVALTDDEGRRLTYAELVDVVRRVGAEWAARGIAPGDRVAVLARNSIDMAVTFLGLGWAGAVPVMLNWRLTPGELAEIGAACTPVAIAHDTDFAAGALAVVGDGLRVDVAGAADVPGPSGTSLPSSGGPAFLLHTSGTTGLPKLIALDHEGLLRGCRRLVDMAGAGVGDVHLRFTPLFHLAGLQELVISLLSGGTTRLQAAFDPEKWLDAVEQEKATFGHLPPATMLRVLDAHDCRATKPDTSSLREVWYGTAPASAELVARAVAALGCDLRQVYGMTEAQSPVCILRPEDHRDEGGGAHLGTAGRPLPGWEVRLRTSTGEEPAPGEPGELLLRGGTLFSGYWTASGEAGVGLEEGGWYPTGDVVTIDADGFVTVVDRAKDMVVSGGENVYPAEVERILAQHPGVHEVSVIGVPDATWGEVVHAVVVPTDDQLTADALLEWSRDRIAGFKRPRSVDIVTELPRNASGKVLKRALREPHWAGHTRGVS